MRCPSLLLIVLLAARACAQDFPLWRGPTGDGQTLVTEAPIHWDQTTNVKWKVPLGRPANGSPIVVKGRVLLTLAEDDEGRSRSLYCFDRRDGKQLWVRTATLDRTMPTHKTNPYGGTTPASDGERVVVWHASAGLHAYDLDGKELWKRDLGEFRHEWGYGTSPILHDGKVILNTGPGAASFVTAIDVRTGATVWRTDEPNHLDAEAIAKKRLVGSWCTPLIANVEGRAQIICAQPTRVVAYDPKDGSIIWWCLGVSCERGDLVYSSPVLAGDICVIMGGFEGPSIGVKLGGSGDVTATHRVWHRPREMSNCGSGIALDGHVYIPNISGHLFAIDAKTGVPLLKERISRSATWGSIITAAGRQYLMNQRGATTVFKASPKGFEILATNDVGEPTNSTLAFSDGEIFLRTHRHLYCIAEPK